MIQGATVKTGLSYSLSNQIDSAHNKKLASATPIDKLLKATSQTYKSEAQAAIGASKLMYQITRETKRECGGYLIGKNGVYRLAEPLIGGDPTADAANEKVTSAVSIDKRIVAYYKKMGFTVTILHSHPDAIGRADGTVVKYPKGPSLQDFKAMGEFGLRHCYLVTGDGDVIRFSNALPGERSSKNPLEQAEIRVIGDVAPLYDSGLPLNGWLVDKGVERFILDPKQIKK
jgi:hypothetical protein